MWNRNSGASEHLFVKELNEMHSQYLKHTGMRNIRDTDDYFRIIYAWQILSQGNNVSVFLFACFVFQLDKLQISTQVIFNVLEN